MSKKKQAQEQATEDRLSSELKKSLFFYPKPTDSTDEPIPSSPEIDAAVDSVPPSAPETRDTAETETSASRVRGKAEDDRRASSPTQAAQAPQLPIDIPNARTNERTTERSNGAATDRPMVRDTTRYSFEFYRDQIEHLRRLSFEDRMHGGKRTMSDIVREAIDRYFDSTDERTTERSNERTEHR